MTNDMDKLEAAKVIGAAGTNLVVAIARHVTVEDVKQGMDLTLTLIQICIGVATFIYITVKIHNARRHGRGAAAVVKEILDDVKYDEEP